MLSHRALLHEVRTSVIVPLILGQMEDESLASCGPCSSGKKEH